MLMLMAQRRSSNRRTFGGWFNDHVKHIFLGLLAVAVASVTVIAFQHARPAPTAASQARPTVAPAPSSTAEASTVVAFLGDSYIAGSSEDSGPNHQWADLVSKTNGWVQKDFAVGGSGYFQPGLDGETFADRVDRIVTLGPDMVVVSGGFNDTSTRLPEFQPAVNSVLSRLRAGLPEARIVVLSNFVPNGSASVDQQTKRDTLAVEAAAVAAAFIDVTELFTGYTDLIGADRTHPTDAGHARIAEIVGPQLVALG